MVLSYIPQDLAIDKAIFSYRKKQTNEQQQNTLSSNYKATFCLPALHLTLQKIMI